MNRRDLLAGFFWLAIAVFVCFESIHTDLGKVHSPGPGFLPFWSAVVLGALSTTLIIIAGRHRNWKKKREKGKASSSVSTRHFRNFLYADLQKKTLLIFTPKLSPMASLLPAPAQKMVLTGNLLTTIFRALLEF